MKWISIAALLLFGLLAACAPAEAPVAEEAPATAVPDTAVPPTPTEKPMIELPDLGPAPEFKNEVWLNADAPVTLASLRGQVVLLEFWTFG